MEEVVIPRGKHEVDTSKGKVTVIAPRDICAREFAEAARPLLERKMHESRDECAPWLAGHGGAQ